MDIRQQIKKFDEENKPFYMVDHGDGEYSLCLPLSSLKGEYSDFGQEAFNQYAVRAGEPVTDINNITQYVKKQNNADAEDLNGYIRNMEETVSRLDFGYQTGNPITDIIIHQKKQEADRARVKFSVDFSYPKELQIDVYDIGVILNNALENAIEAATQMERDKYVSLHSYVNR